VAGKIPRNYRGVDREYDRELKINGRKIPLKWPERRGNVSLASIRGEYESGKRQVDEAEVSDARGKAEAGVKSKGE